MSLPDLSQTAATAPKGRPLRLLILSYGSRGDVQLYIALGLGLAARGHRVTLACPARFRDFVESHGLAFAPLSDAMLDLLDTDTGRAFLETAGSPVQFLTQLHRIVTLARPLQDELMQESWQIAQATRPDLIVFHPKTYGGPDIAERLGIPAILSLPVPYIVPTREMANTIFPELDTGDLAGLAPLKRVYNLLTYRSVVSLMGLITAPYRSGLRSTLGLPRAPVSEALRFTPSQGIGLLHAVSRYVVPEPADWPENAWMTGYWFLDDGKTWSPPPALAGFLAEGPAPVYVGFGSMAGRDPAQLGAVVVEALRRAGLRAVLASGWGGMRLGSLPPELFVLDAAPHDWLFPRMSAVVHHGGAGTTAAGLRAGKPTVVVPFFGDQPYWGRRVAALGVGPQPLPAAELTPEALAEALTLVTHDPAMRARAKTLGARIRAEDGVGEAVRRIEAFAAVRARAARPPRT